MQAKSLEILQHYWGYPSFRIEQEKIINTVLSGKDTLALLPTGGGKSICYQIPALVNDGICIVISPLVALMNDQVEGLRKRRIKADMISSAMTPRQIDIALDNCIYGDTKFLFLSPERINSILIKSRIKQMNVNLFAIDEAHCISQWGHDFRPAYKNVELLREIHPNTPILALTATATKQVAKDIANQLGFDDGITIKASFKRDNIFHIVERVENKYSALEKVLNNHQGSTIIYLRSRKRTVELAKTIESWGFKAAYYHAGLDSKQRKEIESNWKKDKTPIVVSTNAFGMGIDKPDVRLVVHMDIPSTMEEFYQESGRAGRDGEKSYSYIIYNNEDIDYQEKLLQFRFPERKLIKSIYNSLGNFFQVGSGGGQGLGFVFDLRKFASTFDYDPLSVHYAIDILQKEGYIYVSDDVTKSSKLKIIQGRTQIESVLANDNFQSKVLSVLLRSHTNLFKDYVAISESTIAERLETTEHKIGNSLQILEKIGVVHYKRKNFHPRIVYSTERIDAQNIAISKELLEERKKVAERQLKYMIDFVEEQDKCRTNIALFYFNEVPDKRCGFCDNCSKSSSIKQVKKAILEVLNSETDFQSLLNELNFPREDIIEGVRVLLEEKSIIRTGNTIRKNEH